MSKECIPDCPRIQAAIENFPEDALPAIAVTELLEACRAAYDCKGPEIGEVNVVVGFFRRHNETQSGFVCGLPE
jgi:hypothetical protein